eukprot:COSAG06_NODE_23020_length_705_cov_0.838284_1_plen_69_part_10
MPCNLDPRVAPLLKLKAPGLLRLVSRGLRLRHDAVDLAARCANVREDALELAQLVAAWRSPQAAPEHEH